MKAKKREVLGEGCLKSVRLKSEPFKTGSVIVNFNSCGHRRMGVPLDKRTDVRVRLVLEFLE